MSTISDPGLAQASLYTDFSGLDRLRTSGDDEASLRAAAQQFEALFTQTLLKQMREAMPKGGLFDSDQGRFYEQMFDQQLASSLSAQGGLGLGEILVRQLSRNLPEQAATDNAAKKEID